MDTWECQMQVDRVKGRIWVCSPKGFTLLRVKLLVQSLPEDFGEGLCDIIVSDAIVTKKTRVDS